MEIHLIDGTYELIRHYYALPSARDQEGREVAAVRGVLASFLGMIKGGVSYLGVATDHVIESFGTNYGPVIRPAKGSTGPAGSVLVARRHTRGCWRGSVADGRVRGRRCAGVGSARPGEADQVREDFHLLLRLKVFNTEHMNQAVFAFRRYEDASLYYTGVRVTPD